MKKVLIAIDYNPFSQHVAESGYAFARDLNAKVCIVHVIADISHYSVEYSPIMGFEGFEPDSAFKNLQQQDRDAMCFLNAVRKYLEDTTIETKVLAGLTSEAILMFASEYGADIIIIGSHSHFTPEWLKMGNNAIAIVRHAEIPVLIIPANKLKDNTEQKVEVLQYI